MFGANRSVTTLAILIGAIALSIALTCTVACAVGPTPVSSKCHIPSPSTANSSADCEGGAIQLQARFYQLEAQSNYDPDCDHYVIYAALAVDPEGTITWLLDEWSLYYKNMTSGGPFGEIEFRCVTGTFETASLEPAAGKQDETTIAMELKASVEGVSFGINWDWYCAGFRTLQDVNSANSVEVAYQIDNWNPVEVPRSDGRLWEEQMCTAAVHYRAPKGSSPTVQVTGWGGFLHWNAIGPDNAAYTQTAVTVEVSPWYVVPVTASQLPSSHIVETRVEGQPGSQAQVAGSSTVDLLCEPGDHTIVIQEYAPSQSPTFGERYRCQGNSKSVGGPRDVSFVYDHELRLDVVSDYGDPQGAGWYDAGDAVIAFVASPDGRYHCTGYTGSGSAPAEGSSSSVNFELNEPSEVEFNWQHCTPPQADFTADPTEGRTPLTVEFEDQSSGTIKTWHWEFGDGHTSSNEAPCHTYTESGKYSVSLTVGTPCGNDTKTRTAYIFAEDDPVLSVTPAAMDFGTSDTQKQGEVQNTGGGTLDWDWDDDSGPSWVSNVSPSSGSLAAGAKRATTVTVNRSGLDEGHYSGTIQFTSTNGDNDSIEVEIDVEPHTVTATIDTVSPNPAKKTQAVHFVGRGNCTQEHTITAYEWKSSRNGIIGNQASFDKSGLLLGNHDISLRVKCSEGTWSDWAAWSGNPLEVVVTHTVTAAIDTVSPNPAEPGQAVHFAGHGECSRGHNITAYEWKSSRDGIIGNQASFDRSDLSVGSHDISLRVQCSEGTWSDWAAWSVPLVVDGERYALTVNCSPSDGGQVKVDGTLRDSGWSAKFDCGTDVFLEAVAAENRTFVKWSGDVSGSAASTNVTMNGDKNVTAEFVSIGTYSISGTVTDKDGDGVAGVTVTADGQTDTTDANGDYAIGGLAAGTYTVTPSKDGCIFDPASREVTVGPDKTEADFTGTCNGSPTQPVTPTPTKPEDDETVTTLTPRFEWSAFEHGGDGDTQAGWQLRVRCDDDDQAIVYDTGFVADTSGHIHTYAPPGTYTGNDPIAGCERVSEPLKWGKHYHWHVRYRDSGGDWSRWAGQGTAGDTEAYQDFYTGTRLCIDLQRGWNIIALGQPLDTTVTFGRLLGSNAIAVYAWDAERQEYEEIPLDSPISVLPSGWGIWVLMYSARTVCIPIKMPPDPNPSSVTVCRGWNLLGNPFPVGIDLGHNFEPTSGDDNLNDGYVWLNPPGEYAQATSLTAGQAAWVLVALPEGAPCTNAEFNTRPAPPPGGASATAVRLQTRPDVPEGSTCIQLAARSGDSIDAGNWFGVTTEALGWKHPKPPTAPGSVSVYLDTEDYGVGYGTSLVPSNERSHVWTATVVGAAGQEIELYLPDTSRLPGDMAVWLEDLTTGAKADLRHAQGYSYKARAGQRQFKLWLGKHTGSVQISSVTTQATSVSAQIAYILSADADVAIEIRNIAGRLIRGIPCGTAAAGLNTATWNLRNATGAPVPSGTYLCTVTARANDGSQTTVVRSVHVRR